MSGISVLDSNRYCHSTTLHMLLHCSQMFLFHLSLFCVCYVIIIFIISVYLQLLWSTESANVLFTLRCFEILHDTYYFIDFYVL